MCCWLATLAVLIERPVSTEVEISEELHVLAVFAALRY